MPYVFSSHQHIKKFLALNYMRLTIFRIAPFLHIEKLSLVQDWIFPVWGLGQHCWIIIIIIIRKGNFRSLALPQQSGGLEHPGGQLGQRSWWQALKWILKLHLQLHWHTQHLDFTYLCPQQRLGSTLISQQQNFETCSLVIENLDWNRLRLVWY